MSDVKPMSDADLAEELRGFELADPIDKYNAMDAADVIDRLAREAEYANARLDAAERERDEARAKLLQLAETQPKVTLIPARVKIDVAGRLIYSKVDDSMQDLTHDNCEGFIVHTSSYFVRTRAITNPTVSRRILHRLAVVLDRGGS